MNLNRVTKQLSVSRLFGIILAAVLLAACASEPNQSSGQPGMPSAFSEITKNAQWYLEQVDPAKPAEAFTWQMLAARSYLALGQSKPAAALFQQLQKQAQSPEQKAQLQLLQAHLLLAQGHANQALILLEGKPDVALDADTQKNWYRQRVVLQLDINNKFGAAKSLIAMEPYLAQSELTTNHQQIWSLLKSMTPSTLQALEEAPAPDVTTGWLRLAALVNEFGAQPNLLARQLDGWKRDFPNHPAQSDMPAGLGDLASTSGTTVQQIAVLLPLSGNLEPQGAAIRNGMLMSYKENQGQFTLNFYDTQLKSTAELYKQAIQEGADMIIGPLLKDRVGELLKANPTVPVLALNELDQPIVNDSTYYFSLSAAADAAQAAQYLYGQGYRKPLLIAAQGRIGYSSIKAFEQTWATLSQDKPVVATFGARNEVQGMVKNALSGRSTARAGEVVQLSDAAPRSIDAVYVVANSLETRMIKPYVDISVNPMGSLPIYTGSRGYDSAATEVASELNGLHIGEMPLLLGGFEKEREQIALLWPQTQGDLLRLFAMGYDAISLAENLPQMRKLGTMQQAGMSGQLSVDAKGNIIRTLNWGTYRNGKLVDDNAAPQLEAPSNEESIGVDEPAVAEPVPVSDEQGTVL
ncbi:penicillin-binding protein activator [Aeromonas enteropelogenes]|uniref:penicillin-binding protein activator n=2 Tax=Aeromonadaceae TaxID=84642 RepID=UPI00191E8FD9|nr:penicillin-binding protein activator [Aeromonas enteropelogenes]MBL0458108.1 penicillin-binding protein activator [Aeromonas enteropelogenes]QXC35260.1 penicillin-binding protein activator [Aeromonas sp. FDAARGOS 1407]UAK72058.1 penicillin-binding protein activator [Aeromonas enteropelogenes]